MHFVPVGENEKRIGREGRKHLQGKEELVCWTPRFLVQTLSKLSPPPCSNKRPGGHWSGHFRTRRADYQPYHLPSSLPQKSSTQPYALRWSSLSLLSINGNSISKDKFIIRIFFIEKRIVRQFYIGLIMRLKLNYFLLSSRLLLNFSFSFFLSYYTRRSYELLSKRKKENKFSSNQERTKFVQVELFQISWNLPLLRSVGNSRKKKF